MGAPEFFWQNVANVPATGRTVTVDNVDGGPGAPSDAAGTGETDLDVEQSGGLAPGANVIVYQAPNSDPGFIDGVLRRRQPEHRRHGLDQLGRVRDDRQRGGRRGPGDGRL